MSSVAAKFVVGSQQTIETKFDVKPTKAIETEFNLHVVNKDHNDLYNRELPNQHPISAITGLEDAIEELNSDIIAENERAIAAEESLSDRIENIEESSITDIIGGSNIEVSRDNNVVTINSKTFVFEQAIASDTWIINHNLNKRPNITLTDSSGRVFEADREYVNNNQVIIHLQSATTGFANLN